MWNAWPAHPGNQLVTLAQNATQELVLVAPFVKVQALINILGALSPESRLTVVTRWKPIEIASGVSDIDCFSIVTKREKSKFLLCPNLHAKYYRGDNAILIGSANLTLRAAAWSTASNLEILDPPSSGLARWEAFEEYLLDNSWAPSAGYVEMMRLAVARLSKEQAPIENPPLNVLGNSHGTGAGAALRPFSTWIPQTRTPHQLFLAYTGQWLALSTAVQEQAALDLAVLDLGSGLNEEGFRICVGIMLLQHSLVREIEAQLIVSPMRFGELRRVVRRWLNRTSNGADVTSASQALLRWILEYCPERFVLNTPRYSEILSLREAERIE